jgi:hypothetical protein
MDKRPDVPSVRVTYFYLKLLMDGFVFHASSGPGQSLGKSINLEGGEQVSAKRIKKNHQHTARFRYMQQSSLE